MKALQAPEVKTRIAGLAGEPGTLTIEQFAALNRSDSERYGKLVREAAIKLDE
jgi:tripartite-type tricarboxylate transporter receptor subunit TctC